MENKTIFEMIETKYKESLLNEKQEKTLKKEMEEEIETSTKKIKESYKEKFEVLEQNTKQLNNELSNYNYLLKKYSSFNTKMIGKLLEKIISEIECEPYSFQISNHETYHVESTVYGSEKFKCDTKCAMVVKNNFKDSTYYDRDLYDNVIKKLSNKGNALILYENELIPNDINFYSFSKKEIECLVNFKNFPYVKEFIDLMIEYKFKNNLLYIPEDTLLILINEFILSKQNLIDSNLKKQYKNKLKAIAKSKAIELKAIKESKEKQEILERNERELNELLNNGLPKNHDNNLIDRLKESVENNINLKEEISKITIQYENQESIASISCDEPTISLENIFISKINIKSTIKDFYDDSYSDKHFWGFSDIDIVDDGLLGILDISNIKENINEIMKNFKLPYKIDIFENKYLRVLYLPNNMKYRHESGDADIFSWILSVPNKEQKNDEVQPVSYIKDWNKEEETDKMLKFLKEFELLTNLNSEQIELYKTKKLTYKKD